ncbi:MAG: cytochrome c4 [Gammaproteobacteria bacterium]|nr:cytochrome c4 [Gammaproteobacteria bacterium]
MISRSMVVLWVLSVAANAGAVGNAATGKIKAQACAACHGVDGNASATFPKLAGQHSSYIALQLHNFKLGIRKDPIMTQQVANLKDQDIEDLAAYFSSNKVSLGGVEKDKKNLGERVYRGGIEQKAVPACMGCHGPTGVGNAPAKFPSLSGQNPAYVEKTMKDFRVSIRGGEDKDNNGKIMRDIASRMSDEEIAAVASYVSGLH